MQPLAVAPSSSDTRSQLGAILAEQKRRQWKADPVLWARERLGDTLWWAQRDILYALRDNRRVAVQSANGIAKTFTAAIACAWWLDVHPVGQAFVVTSSKTAGHLKRALWREIHRAKARGKLKGRLNQTEWYMPTAEGDEELVAIGIKPADEEPDAIKGVHAPAVLVIFDEAQALDRLLWSAAGTLITSEQSRFLAIFNPDDPLCYAAEVSAPGSGWKHLKISAFDSPNYFCAFKPGTFGPDDKLSDVALASLVSPVATDGIIQQWGIDHPFTVSQVFGEFPQLSSDTLIPMQWIRRAQESKLAPGTPIEAGVDVGGGVNKSVIAIRHGQVAHIHSNKSTPDTSVILEDLMRLCNPHGFNEPPSLVKVDAIGIGNTVASVAVSGQLTDGGGNPVKLPVVGINVGGSARDKENYGNLRAEGYWFLRELFRNNQIRIPSGTPEAEALAGQLVALKYRSLSGRLYVEEKSEVVRRLGGQSPDLADALMLAFLPAESIKKYSVTWGTGKKRRR